MVFRERVGGGWLRVPKRHKVWWGVTPEGDPQRSRWRLAVDWKELILCRSLRFDP
jgi:hypothetical protein